MPTKPRKWDWWDQPTKLHPWGVVWASHGGAPVSGGKWFRFRRDALAEQRRWVKSGVGAGLVRWTFGDGGAVVWPTVYYTKADGTAGLRRLA